MSAAVSSPAQATGEESDEDVPPDAVPLGWLVPSEVDLSQNPLVKGAVDVLEALSGVFGPEGTTECPKEAKPDGKLPTCTD